MFRRIKSRRGLSPVITTMFLMGIIIAAIGVSLGIIFPNVENLNDQIDLEINSSNLIAIDENFRDMMLNGYTSKLLYSFDLGASSFLFGDLSSTTIIQMKYQTVSSTTGQIIEDILIAGTPQSPGQFNETQNRLIIKQEITDIVSRNTHQYLIGSGVQNKFYLNSIDRASIGWTALNQSRFDDSFVYTALTYRNLISVSKTVSTVGFEVNITISIQRVKFDFIGKMRSSINLASLEAEYKGLNVTTYGWTTINNAGVNDRIFYIQTITNLDYGDPSLTGLSNTEIPFSREVPEPSSLNVRMQFIDHIIQIRI